MKKITPLIHADPERSDNGVYLLPGAMTGFTQEQIRAGHEVVTPILNVNGELNTLEVQPTATVVDICAVLHSCGILVQGLAGDFAIDQLSRPIRYSVVPDPEIGENIISLVPIPNQDIIY